MSALLNLLAVVVVLMMFGCVLGFGLLLGTHFERVRWNKLIAGGLIPRPANRRHSPA